MVYAALHAKRHTSDMATALTYQRDARGNKWIGTGNVFHGRDSSVIGNDNEIFGDCCTVNGDRNRVSGVGVHLTGNDNVVGGATGAPLHAQNSVLSSDSVFMVGPPQQRGGPGVARVRSAAVGGAPVPVRAQNSLIGASVVHADASRPQQQQHATRAPAAPSRPQELPVVPITAQGTRDFTTVAESLAYAAQCLSRDTARLLEFSREGNAEDQQELRELRDATRSVAESLRTIAVDLDRRADAIARYLRIPAAMATASGTTPTDPPRRPPSPDHNASAAAPAPKRPCQ